MWSGEILWDPTTDFHEHLMTTHHIRDGLCQQGKFARIELTPPKDHTQIADLTKWDLKVDEESTPEWFNHEEVRSKLSTIVQGMFVSDARDRLSDGCYILLDGANIEEVKNCRIFCMLGSSEIGSLLGSSQIGCMYDSSQVGDMYGSSKVGYMYDSSLVIWMHGSSKVGVNYGAYK
jgi:hypothetical protein